MRGTRPHVAERTSCFPKGRVVLELGALSGDFTRQWVRSNMWSRYVMFVTASSVEDAVELLFWMDGRRQEQG